MLRFFHLWNRINFRMFMPEGACVFESISPFFSVGLETDTMVMMMVLLTNLAE